MGKLVDMTGRRYGRLTVQCRAQSIGCGQPRWHCICDCGAAVDVFGNSLRSGATVSCGCYHRETITTHGASKIPEFTVWQMMIQRCENTHHTSYADYGGRGIVVCSAWRESFEKFLADMGPRPSPTHTVEREDNEGPYSPSNCRWATPLEQGSNKRNNLLITIGDETMHAAAWARRAGLPLRLIAKRWRAGWVGPRLLQPSDRASRER